MGMLLLKASMDDCERIHKIQIESFKELLDKYHDFKTNPGAEPLDRIMYRMAQDFTDYYFICLDDMKVGAIRIVRLKDNVCRISPMFILPEYQGKGFAQQAIQKAEALYPQTRRWELDTIKQEDRLCYLYEKMGYRATGKEEYRQDGMTIIYYAK